MSYSVSPQEPAPQNDIPLYLPPELQATSLPRTTKNPLLTRGLTPMGVIPSTTPNTTTTTTTTTPARTGQQEAAMSPTHQTSKSQGHSLEKAQDGVGEESPEKEPCRLGKTSLLLTSDL
jgi:hypothetical protein